MLRSKARRKERADQRKTAYDRLETWEKLVKLNKGGYAATRQRLKLDAIQKKEDEEAEKKRREKAKQRANKNKRELVRS